MKKSRGEWHMVSGCIQLEADAHAHAESGEGRDDSWDQAVAYSTTNRAGQFRRSARPRTRFLDSNLLKAYRLLEFFKSRVHPKASVN